MSGGCTFLHTYEISPEYLCIMFMNIVFIFFVSLQSESQWPFNERRALAVCRDMALALSFMHDKGYAHRDMKPLNILLAIEEGQVSKQL